MKQHFYSPKRFLALLLASLMLVLCFAGCQPNEPAVSEPESANAAESALESSSDMDEESLMDDPTHPSDPTVDTSSSNEGDATTAAGDDNRTDSNKTTTKTKDSGKTSGSTATTKSTSSSTTKSSTESVATTTTTKPKPEDPSNGYHQSQFFISTFKAMPHSAGSTLEEYKKIVQLHKEAGINLIENAIMSRQEGLLAMQACEEVGVKFLAQNVTADKGYSGMGANCPDFTEDTIQFVVDELKDHQYLEGYSSSFGNYSYAPRMVRNLSRGGISVAVIENNQISRSAWALLLIFLVPSSK